MSEFCSGCGRFFSLTDDVTICDNCGRLYCLKCVGKGIGGNWYCIICYDDWGINDDEEFEED